MRKYSHNSLIGCLIDGIVKKMRYIIQKLKYSWAITFFGLSLGMAFVLPASVYAAEQTSSVSCVNGGSTFNITPNNTSHTTTVTCKDGSNIVYNNSAGQQGLTGLAVNCKGASVPGLQVQKTNAPNAKLVYYCVLGGGTGDNGNPTRAKVTPTVTPVAAQDAKCPDGVTALPKDGDVSKCPAADGGGNCSSVNSCDLIQKYINPFINFLAALVGIAVVISIIIGGIQYGSSGGDPSKVTAAKNRIRNAIIALVTFLFLYALLNFLIPGGLV